MKIVNVELPDDDRMTNHECPVGKVRPRALDIHSRFVVGSILAEVELLRHVLAQRIAREFLMALGAKIKAKMFIGRFGEIGVVDFVIVEAVVEETAEARARRRWHMDERKADDVH